MLITPNEFRTAMPVFMNPSCYPDGEINFWAALAEKLHNADRWGDLLPFGQQLFIAHNLALDAVNRNAVAAGQAPGQIVGAVTSGSVDKVSYSRDATAMMEDGAGHWNLTTYGLRYRRLVLMVGAGPVQVSPNPFGSPIATSAWPGVIMPLG